MNKTMLVALTILGFGCSASEQDATSLDTASNLDKISDGGTNPYFWFGSDTLKTATLTAEGTGYAGTKLKYQGKGSGIGEACMRSGAKSTGFCATLKSDAGTPYQVLAPMSRDFKDNTGLGECFNGAAPDGGHGGTCCPGERSNAIGLDGVDIWVKYNDGGAPHLTDVNNLDGGETQTAKNYQLERLFCGLHDTDGGIFPTGCITSFTDILDGGTFTAADAGFGALGIYRRNDSSGTTATFQSLAFCSPNSGITAAEPYAWCPGVVSVDDSADSSHNNLLHWYDRSGVEHDAGAPIAYCANGSTATQCIGRLVTQGYGFIGYAGGSALIPDAGSSPVNVKLLVDGIESTTGNIQNLISGGTPVYPLARRLWLNENIEYRASTDEINYYSWLYNPATSGGIDKNKKSFETILVNNDFVPCSSSGALQCGVGVCYGPYADDGGINDGRGVGNCRAAVAAPAAHSVTTLAQRCFIDAGPFVPVTQ